MQQFKKNINLVIWAEFQFLVFNLVMFWDSFKEEYTNEIRRQFIVECIDISFNCRKYWSTVAKYPHFICASNFWTSLTNSFLHDRKKHIICYLLFSLKVCFLTLKGWTLGYMMGFSMIHMMRYLSIPCYCNLYATCQNPFRKLPLA